MGKRSANQVRVFADGEGFKVIRRETREHAEQLVLREMLRPEFDQVTGELLGYRVVGLDKRKVDSDRPSTPSSTSISVSEMEMNLARSKHEDDRPARVKAKVRVYVQVGPGRGDILRVWPKR